MPPMKIICGLLQKVIFLKIKSDMSDNVRRSFEVEHCQIIQEPGAGSKCSCSVMIM